MAALRGIAADAAASALAPANVLQSLEPAPYPAPPPPPCPHPPPAPLQSVPASLGSRCSVYLLYWYKVPILTQLRQRAQRRGYASSASTACAAICWLAQKSTCVRSRKRRKKLTQVMLTQQRAQRRRSRCGSPSARRRHCGSPSARSSSTASAGRCRDEEL